MDKGTHEVFISMGSNQGDRIYHLNRGVQALQAIALLPVQCSPVYETVAVGPVEQADFLNLVVSITTRLTPRKLLQYLLDVEQENGRIRTIRFGPRTLDLDILLYDNNYICYQDLQIPHPRMWERAFVLVPLSTLVPDRKGLGGQSIQSLAHSMSQTSGEVHSEEGDVRNVGRFW